MEEIDIKKTQKNEINRIKRLLKSANVPKLNIDLINPIIENTAMMKAKLDEERLILIEEELVVEYNHGGGQCGTKENAHLKAYETLWKAYIQGMNKILDCLPKTAASIVEKETKKAENVLELVRSKHKKEA